MPCLSCGVSWSRPRLKSPIDRSAKCQTLPTSEWETAPDRHCVSLSDNFGLSSKGSSALSTFLGLNNASPISPRINRTVPVTISPCGYAKSKSKAFVILFRFAANRQAAAGVGGPLPARHHNPLNALAFLGLSRVGPDCRISPTVIFCWRFMRVSMQ